MTRRLPPEAGEQLLGIARGAIEVRLTGTPTAQIPLDEIARRAGFCHAQYLSAIFKRECGQTPGDYRRRAR